MQTTLETGEPVMKPLNHMMAKFTEPFSSWPKEGRPEGYYTLPLPSKAEAFYKEHGFLVVEKCISAEGIAELREETTQVCRGHRGALNGIMAAAPDETDAEVLTRYLCIHFPHKVSETMKRYVAHPMYVDVLTRIIGPNVKCMQSMLFIKASGKPGQAWHQDEFFIPTRDRSLTGGWLAMDDATVENGCLWILPGSHKRGIIYPSHAHNDRRFDCVGEAMDFPWKDEDAVPVEVKVGSIVFFNGYLLHRSFPNYAKTGYRRALVNHYMSAESLLPWMKPREHETMATADSRDILMVVGEDPYSWKGMEQTHNVLVRPSGEGGCVTSNSKPAQDAAGDGKMGGGMEGQAGGQMA